jgi:hypothetical protein
MMFDLENSVGSPNAEGFLVTQKNGEVLGFW